MVNRLRTDVFIIWVSAMSFFGSVALQAAAELPPWNVSLVAQTGGGSYAIGVVDRYAYLGEGATVTILDVSDPSSPDPVGCVSFNDFYVIDIQVGDGVAYLAGNSLAQQPGLQIVDVRNSRSPQVFGFYPTSDVARGVFVTDGLAYVAGDGYFLILDVIDPTSPTLRGSSSAPARDVSGIYVSAGRAYVSAFDGLHIFDVTDPCLPEHLAVYSQHDSNAVFVTGGLAYTATGEGLEIVDVTSPTAPTRRGRFLGSQAYGLFVSDDLLFLARPGPGLGIISVANPASPTLVGSYATLGRPDDVTVSSGTAYLADRNGGLAIIDVTVPSSPTLRATYDTLSDARDVYVADGVAYVANGVRGLKTIDISSPRSPKILGSLAIPGSASRISVAGNSAYICANQGVTIEEQRSFLHILDIATPSSPRLLGSYTVPQAFMYGLAISGELAYIAFIRELRIVDVSDPSSPTLRGSFPTPGWESDVCVTGDLAFVADYSSLQIIDVSNPTAPFRRSSYPGARLSDVFVSNGVAYISGGTPDFACIDVRNPDAPGLLGEYALSGWIYDTEGLHVSIGLAYVFMDDLRVLDVSDPTNPTLRGYFPIARSPFGNDVFACDGFVYLASWSGLRILQYTGGGAEARRWRLYR